MLPSIASAATGLIINPIWGASVTSNPNAAQIESVINTQINVLESTLSNSVTVNLNVGYGDIGGQALPTTEAGAASLGIGGFQLIPFQTLSAAFAGRAVNPGPVDPQPYGHVLVANANAVALGLLANQPVTAYVGFANFLNWDFSSSPTIACNAYDFSGVVAHEITHVLGRYADSDDTLPWLYDFYRYSAPGVLDVSHTNVAGYFSTDGGVTALREFDYYGDISDWAPTVNNDSFGRALIGEKEPVTAPDWAAMNAIGWNTYAATDFTSTIQAAYQTFFGRAPTTAETAVWQQNLSTRTDTMAAFRQILVMDASGQAHVGAEIKTLYDTWFGRDPTDAELHVWLTLIGQGADYTSVQAALIADPIGAHAATGDIAALYESYFARAPTSAETSVWLGLFSQGQDLGDLTTALQASPETSHRTIGVILNDYLDYFGRYPSNDEVTVWRGILAADGSDYAGMRATILADPTGQAHTAAVVTSLYDTYFGRDPNPSEISVWQGLIAGGAEFTDVRAALVRDASGQAYAAKEITTLYDAYFGRDPSAAEISTWSGLLAGGQDYAAVKGALLGDTNYAAHGSSAIQSLYEEYFGRSATAAEVSTWQGLLAGGDTLFQLQDTLARQSTSANVTHVVTAGVQSEHDVSFAGPNMTIDGAYPYYDQINLSTAQFGDIDPYDATHVRQVTALDGTTDVLVMLDPTHSILIEHAQQYQLSSVSFVFH